MLYNIISCPFKIETLMIRAINIDWLELYCLEPIDSPRTPEYFQSCGYKVKVREYGTPVYRQMFTIFKEDKEWIEIRRDPYSKKGEGGFLEPTSTHIKLCNEFCYTDNPIDELRAFLIASDYTYKAISRIDICMDFNNFEGDISINEFIQKYMAGEISKINQSNLCCHGKDQWAKRIINSLKWGAASSPFSTKLYNKSQELRECKDKLWIKQAWLDAGLDLSRDVWRIEFSTSSQAQTREAKKTKKAFKLHIVHFDSRDKLLMRFFELYEKYFDFRIIEKTINEDGTIKMKRKDRCKRPTLLYFSALDIAYKPTRNKTARQRPERTYKILINKLKEIAESKYVEREYKEAFRILISYLTFKLSYQIQEIKITEHEELFKMQAYAYRMGQLELENMKEAAKEKELLLLQHLMTKYGYNVNYDPELPF